MTKIIFMLVSLYFYEMALCQNKLQFDTASFNNIQNEVGKEFLFFNYKSLNGKEFNSKNLKGKFTLINFWFEACEPCIAEFGTLNKIYNKYKTNKKFQLFSFTFESTSDTKKIAKKYSIKYPIISISKEKCYKLNFNHGFPTNIITDSFGRVAFIIVGGAIDPIEVEKSFDNTIVLKLEELLRNSL